MRFFFIFSLFTNIITAYSQVICDGKIVMPTVELNYCNPNWALIFNDDFNDDSLNTNYWSIQEGVVRDPIFNDQKGWLDKSNIQVKDGILNVSTNQKPLETHCFDIWIDNGMQQYCDDFEFTCGEIWTEEYFEYGMFEARIKIPSGKGLWPAFWLFGGNPHYNEIDIFEFRYDDTKDHNMDVHFDPDFFGNLSCQTDYKGPDFSKDFHTFGLIWTPSYIQWTVDGKIMRTDYKYYSLLGQVINCDIKAGEMVIMNLNFPSDPMQLILNVAIQANEDAPDNKTIFPNSMEIDWVKVYKMEL